MPERRTKMMPAKAARSSQRGRPPLGLGGSEGSSGAKAAQRSSDAIVGYKGLAHSPPTPKCQFWQVALVPTHSVLFRADNLGPPRALPGRAMTSFARSRKVEDHHLSLRETKRYGLSKLLEG